MLLQLHTFYNTQYEEFEDKTGTKTGNKTSVYKPRTDDNNAGSHY